MNKKILLLPLFAILIVGTVFAITNFYGMFSVTLNVTQPIDVLYNGHSIFGEEQLINLDCDAGEVCLGKAIQLKNTGDVDKSVFAEDVSPDGVNIDYVGKMIFVDKNLVTGEEGTNTEEIVFSVTGEEFVATGIPSTHKLVYYPDMGDFVTNVANIKVYSENTFPSLPILTDIGDDYCNVRTGDNLSVANPNALACNGAKMWLVENDYVSQLKTGTWTPSNILFETNLITYTVSSDGEILVPARSELIIYPEYTVDTYISGGDKIVSITVA